MVVAPRTRKSIREVYIRTTAVSTDNKMNVSDSDEESDTPSKQVKVVLLGDPATGKVCDVLLRTFNNVVLNATPPARAGKAANLALLWGSHCLQTSLARRLCGETHPVQHIGTQGVEFRLKRTTLAVPATRGAAVPQPIPVTAELWDVAGDALEGSMIDQYIFGAQVVMLVFDIASAASLEALTDWLERTRKVSAQMEQRPFITVVGNKFDLEHERAVRYDRQLKFVHENGLTFHCVSAKTGENIEMCFQKILAGALDVRLARPETLVTVGTMTTVPTAGEGATPVDDQELQKVQSSTTCCVQ